MRIYLKRGTAKEKSISKKMQEKRINWYGHIKRTDERYVGRKTMDTDVVGKRKRGRPTERLGDCIKDDLRKRAT